MITQAQLDEISNTIENSENPLFFFDDDPDGLCSYLLLKRKFNKGKGVVVKASPKLEKTYARKVHEYSPDKVFILDKPILTQEFIDEIHVPIIWIDHHEPINIKGVHYYNPRFQNKEDNRPVSYWCYKIAKQDLWLAMAGIVGDWHLPEFAQEFSKEYPDLLPKNIKDPGQALFETEFGKLSRVFSFILKNSVSEVMRCVNILTKIQNPYEILNQTTPRGKYLYKIYERINKKYQQLFEKAIQTASMEKILLFTYPSGKMSFTGDLSNELLYKFPNRLIIIGREKNNEMRLSLRSSKIKLPPIINKALKTIPGYGGGHDYACGANILKKDLEKFVDIIRDSI